MIKAHITTIKIALTFVILVSITDIVKARPKGLSIAESNIKYDTCDEEVIELCQQCAKVTKSPIVYPLCCDKKDGAQSWCTAYVRYGIHM